MTEQAASIEFLVTNTEADALLAEQQFIKRHRPTYNIRLRDDKSYPYIAISLDEEFPRVYFTRERHRRARLYFGPYSNAKRTRECSRPSASSFNTAPARGRSWAGVRARPASITTSSAARRPASATSTARSTGGT